eukprot:6847770-Prymnesium_polylepis.1
MCLRLVAHAVVRAGSAASRLTISRGWRSRTGSRRTCPMTRTPSSSRTEPRRGRTSPAGLMPGAAGLGWQTRT